MNTEKLSNENENEALNKHVVMQTLPLAFVKWYSGMEEGKILKAYERWQKESVIVSVGQRSAGQNGSDGGLTEEEYKRTHKLLKKYHI